MNEIWKDVVGYSGVYDVSDFGRVRSLDRLTLVGSRWKGRILKQSPATGGHLTVSLCNRKQKTRFVHQLVCEAFIGPCPDGMEVCHGPNGKLDNSISNLRYGTRSDNEKDKIRDGTSRSIPVIRGDGREFVNAYQGARENDCWQQNIHKCCKGKRKTAGGHIWRYK